EPARGIDRRYQDERRVPDEVPAHRVEPIGHFGGDARYRLSQDVGYLFGGIHSPAIGHCHAPHRASGSPLYRAAIPSSNGIRIPVHGSSLGSPTPFTS